MVDAVRQQPAAQVLALGNVVFWKKKKKKRILRSLELTSEASSILSKGKRQGLFLGLLLFQSFGDYFHKTEEHECKEGRSHRQWVRAEDRVSQERELFPTPDEEFVKAPPMAMAIDTSLCQEQACALFLCSPLPAPTRLQVTLNLVAATVALHDRDKLVLV